MRSMCPDKDHFTGLTLLVVSVTFVSDPNVGPSVPVSDVQHTSFHVGLLCPCLVGLHASEPYVIPGTDRTQELYTCLSRQMATLHL